MIRFIIQLGKSKMILTMIIFIGIVMGYFSYSGSSELVVEPINEASVRDNLSSFNDFILNFSILDDKRYRVLEIFGENPVDPGVTGEVKNPFSDLE